MKIRLAVTALIVLSCLGHVTGQDAGPRKGLNALEALIISDSFKDADRLASDILADPGADPKTLAVCGLAVLKAGRLAQAEAVFNKVLSLLPDNPEAHLGLGRIAGIRNDAGAAIDHLRRAVPSEAFYGEALRHLWRTAWNRGRVDDLIEIFAQAQERYSRDGKPLPSWFTNGYGQIRDLAGKTLFAHEGGSDRLALPLITNKMIALTLNGQRAYPFDIDSASADFLTLSPLLAEELGLKLTGSSTATGVGQATSAVRFAVLDKVELGGIAFQNVPVMVSDIRPFAGLKKGLLGTAFLKRFNVTIDVEAKTMTLFPLDRPELLAAGIDRASVAADVPLYCYDATTIEASAGGGPAALYILDTAAAANLVDVDFFAEHIKPKLDPARVVLSGIQGAGGAQSVNRIDGLPIALGPLVFEGQTIHEFPMRELNAIGGRYLAGLIGNPLLWPYRVHMDFRRGRLILEKHRGA
jgi:Aspartyl protease